MIIIIIIITIIITIIYTYVRLDGVSVRDPQYLKLKQTSLYRYLEQTQWMLNTDQQDLVSNKLMATILW